MVERGTPVREVIVLQQNMLSHDPAQRNVCGIPNSEAGKFMYVSNKVRYNLSIFHAIWPKPEDQWSCKRSPDNLA